MDESRTEEVLDATAWAPDRANFDAVPTLILALRSSTLLPRTHRSFERRRSRCVPGTARFRTTLHPKMEPTVSLDDLINRRPDRPDSVDL